jgi:opacity protein-like surface antigen
MLQRMKCAVVLLLALGTVAWIAAGSSTAMAELKKSNRAQTWEFTLPVRYLPSYNIDFDHGTSVDIHDDWGWGFGFGYNFNEKLNLNFEFDWTSADYKATFGSGGGVGQPNDYQASGTLDATSSNFNLTYNFMPKTFTPYFSVGVGWNWIDTNIPQGPPSNYCWWDPWYGYICGSYVDTAQESGFIYGFGLGVRFEPKESFFFRVGANDNWQDYGNYNNTTPSIWTYRLELGWRF